MAGWKLHYAEGSVMDNAIVSTLKHILKATWLKPIKFVNLCI